MNQPAPSVTVSAIATDLADRVGKKADIRGDKATTFCPAHSDKSNRSLSISKKDGAILFKCHAGCEQSAIMNSLESLGYSLRSFFDGPGPSNGGNKTYIADEEGIVRWAKNLPDLWDKSSDQLEFVESYPYTDEENRVLYMVCRLWNAEDMEKTFNAALPWKSGWKKGLRGVRLVLYRLGQLLKAIETGETIYIVEGEKDVKTLEALGFVATTNAFGGLKWEDTYTEVLVKAKRIVLFNDNDWVGYERSKKIATSFLKYDYRPEFITPQGLEHQDVTDFLSPLPESIRREAFLELDKQAFDWNPKIPNPWPRPNQKKKSEDTKSEEASSDTEVRDASNVVAIKKDMNIDGYDALFYTDDGNGKRFVEKYQGQVHFAASSWWVYRDGIYVKDNAAATQMAKDCIYELQDIRPRGCSFDKHQKFMQASMSVSGYTNCLRAASTEPEIKREMDDFDADPYKICVKNGVLDLKTLDLKPHAPKFLCTRQASVPYDSKVVDCPLWESLMELIVGQDEGLYTFLQRVAGLCLTGDMGPQKVFILHGDGQNGKTTWINTIRRIVGSYARSIRSKAFMFNHIENHVDSLAPLAGARLVQAGEISSGARLDEEKIKSWTGGEPAQARFMRGDPFEFTPQGKLLFTTNHLPRVVDMDTGIWRRLLAVPFENTIKNPIANFDQLLKEEDQAILYWMSIGAYEYYEDGGGLKGLAIPESVLSKTENFRDGMDVIGMFLEEYCYQNGEIEASELYKAYQGYCKREGLTVMSNISFGMRIAGKKVEKARDQTTRRVIYKGLSLRPEYEMKKEY